MTATRPFTVLFVCAGNTARSPFAAACARENLSHLDGGSWTVDSAGTRAQPGDEVPAETVHLAKGFGLDLSGHRSRSVTDADCRTSDLILAMGWDQVSDVWSLVPDSWDRVFTIKEFVHYARKTASRPAILFADAADRMRDRVHTTHELRRRTRSDHGFWGGLRPQDLDLPEPDGRGPEAWRTFANAVRLLVGDSMRLIAGPAPDAKATPKRAASTRRKATAAGGKRPNKS